MTIGHIVSLAEGRPARPRIADIRDLSAEPQRRRTLPLPLPIQALAELDAEEELTLRPSWAISLGGLWADPSMPLRGWLAEDVVPAGAGEVCEMCRVASGRRICRAYLMHHPKSGRRLRAGGSCAFRMETGQALRRGTSAPASYHHGVISRLQNAQVLAEGCSGDGAPWCFLARRTGRGDAAWRVRLQVTGLPYGIFAQTQFPTFAEAKAYVLASTPAVPRWIATGQRLAEEAAPPVEKFLAALPDWSRQKLSEWEVSFLRDVYGRGQNPSPKQQQILNRIEERTCADLPRLGGYNNWESPGKDQPMTAL